MSVLTPFRLVREYGASYDLTCERHGYLSELGGGVVLIMMGRYLILENLGERSLADQDIALYIGSRGEERMFA